MQKTLKSYISEYCIEYLKWHFGGNLEKVISDLSGHKPSTVSRVCRTLANEGILKRRIVKNNGINVVQYAYNDLEDEIFSKYAEDYANATQL